MKPVLAILALLLSSNSFAASPTNLYVGCKLESQRVEGGQVYTTAVVYDGTAITNSHAGPFEFKLHVDGFRGSFYWQQGFVPRSTIEIEEGTIRATANEWQLILEQGKTDDKVIATLTCGLDA